jgi:hypothetical protein
MQLKPLGKPLARSVAIAAGAFILVVIPCGGQKRPEFRQDYRGLEKQFEPLLEAHADGDEPRFRELLAGFQLPDAEKWFTEHFAKEHALELTREYQTLTNELARSLTFSMNQSPRGSRFTVRCTRHKLRSNPTVQPKPDAMLPLVEIPVEQFNVELTSSPSPSGRKRVSFLINVVYEGGAYRYLGGGAYPFWSMPEIK